MSRRSSAPDRANPSGFFDRFIATLLGSASGGVAYMSWALWEGVPKIREALSFSGPIRWWMLVGAIVGAIGGLSFAQSMWESVTDDVRSDASFSFWFALVLLGIIVLLAIGIKLSLA